MEISSFSGYFKRMVRCVCKIMHALPILLKIHQNQEAEPRRVFRGIIFICMACVCLIVGYVRMIVIAFVELKTVTV